MNMAEQIRAVLDLNVDGKHITTKRSTLTKYPDSMLAAMFSGRHVIDQDKDGRYVIDCDGKIFIHILEFLRLGTLPPVDVAEVVHRHSDYFGLTELSNILAQFQPVKRRIQLRDMQQRHPEFIKLFQIVSDRLTRNAFHKSTPAIIVIKQIREIKMSVNDESDLISTGLQNELFNTFSQLENIEISCELKFDTFDETYFEQILFLTANRLEELGFAQSVLYKLGSKYDDEVGCFLLCNDAELCTLKHGYGKKIKRQPTIYTE